MHLKKSNMLCEIRTNLCVKIQSRYSKQPYQSPCCLLQGRLLCILTYSSDCSYYFVLIIIIVSFSNLPTPHPSLHPSFSSSSSTPLPFNIFFQSSPRCLDLFSISSALQNLSSAPSSSASIKFIGLS